MFDFPTNPIVVALTWALVQYALKPLIELWIAPTDKKHDSVIQAAAIVLGIALMVVQSIGIPSEHATGTAWLLLTGGGIFSGLTAVGAYHIGKGLQSS